MRPVWLVCLLLITALGARPQSPTGAARKKPKSVPLPSLTAEQRVIHALSRFTFGARPGDIEAVERAGLGNWFEQQLAPEKLDDSALGPRLAALRTVRMAPKDLIAQFPNQAMVRSVSEGHSSMPDDPATRLIFELQIERLRSQTAAASRTQGGVAPRDSKLGNGKTDAPERDTESDAAAADEIAGRLLVLPPNRRLQDMETMPVRDVQLIATALKPEVKARLLNDLPPADRETATAMENPTGLVAQEVQQAKLLRAIYSQRQLQEVMTDFWMNHFNVYINKEAQYYLGAYERDVLRPRALGKFQDLLVAVAHSPAMLYYLDNWLSAGPNSPVSDGARRASSSGKSAPVPGINENYARELMELHTLGVNGGYSQRDVQEVAKVFTGWTIDQPQSGGDFKFDPRRHEPGSKMVLGRTIAGGNGPDGEREGMQVLELLAHQPATAHFIALKLARRFVADDPPADLVNRMAEAFLRSDGEIREVLRVLFASKEFWQPQYYRAKVKTPFEFIASAMRACSADVQNAQPLSAELQRMGMANYGSQPPTGYSALNEAWTNSEALLDRMNFAVQLTTTRPTSGAFCDPAQALAGAALKTPPFPPAATTNRKPSPASGALSGVDVTVQYLERALVPGGVSAQTRSAILGQLASSDQATRIAPADIAAALRTIAGLLLGSPDFQQR